MITRVDQIFITPNAATNSSSLTTASASFATPTTTGSAVEITEAFVAAGKAGDFLFVQEVATGGATCIGFSQISAPAFAVTPTNLPNKFYVMYWIADGKIQLSMPVYVPKIKYAKREYYYPQIEKVIALGFTTGTAAGGAYTSGDGTGIFDLKTTTGGEYELNIVIKTKFRYASQRLFKRSFSVVSTLAASPTFADRTAFIQKFVDNINNDTALQPYITASIASDTVDQLGIKIEGKPQTYSTTIPFSGYRIIDFEASYHQVDVAYTANVLTNNDLIDYSVYTALKPTGNASTNGVKFAEAIGSFAKVSEAEQNLLGYSGRANVTAFPVPFFNTYATAGCTYDVYSFDFVANTEGVLQGRDEKPLGIIIAAKAASSVATNSGTNGKLAITAPAIATNPNVVASISANIANFITQLSGDSDSTVDSGDIDN